MIELLAPVGFAGLLWVAGMVVVACAGGRWTPRSVALAVPVAVLVLTGLGLVQHVMDFRFGPPSATVGLVVAAIMAAVGGVLVRRGRPRRSTSAAERADATITLAGLGVTTALAGAAVWLAGGSTWQTVSQTWDALFDANAVRYAYESGIVDPMRISDFAYPYPQHIYYPTGMHVLGSLHLALFGGNAVVSTNVIAAVIAGTLWPATALIATQFVLGGGRLRTLATLLAAAGFHGVWAPLGWGVLWATALANTMMPLAVAGAAGVLGLTRVRRERRVSMLLLAVGLGAVGLLHPRILVVALVLFSGWWTWWLGSRAWVGRARRGLAVVTAGVAVLPWLVLVVAGLRFAKGDSTYFARQWDVERSWLAEIFGYAVDGPNATIPNLLVGAALILGAVVAWRHPKLRWIVVLYAGALAFDILTANLQGFRPYAAVARFWYNDRYRTIGMPPAFGVLLVTLGVERAWAWTTARWSVPGMRRALAAAVSLAVLAVGTWSATDFLSIRYRVAAESPTASLVSAADREIYAQIAQLVGPGERVLNNANDGSALLYAYTGVKPVFYLAGVRSSTIGGQQLWEKLTLMEPRNTCDLLRADGIRWILNGGEPYQAGIIGPQYAPGMQVPADYFATTLRLHVGQVKLYEVTGCPKA